MDIEQLRQLIRQPEGLKLDFKREFYHLDAAEAKVRERQWGELTKDVLSLANGNVNLVGETGYLIFGVGDQINQEGAREVFDVGQVKASRQQILDKLNAVCAPPLPDLTLELLLLEGQRVFVVSVPPSPHIHETTQRITTSSGRAYPENTIFIRRGEGVHTGSMLEVQAILVEKQRRNHPSTLTIAQTKPILTSRINPKSVFDLLIIFITLLFATLMGIWGFFNKGISNEPVSAIVSFVIGSVIGFLFALVVKFFHWFINLRQSIRYFLIVVFWLPILSLGAMGILTGKNVGDGAAGFVFGSVLGLLISTIIVPLVWFIDWMIAKVRRPVRP